MSKRLAAMEELQRKASDPVMHKTHLLNTSMITGLRESAALT